MSLEGGKCRALDEAVNKAIEKEVHFTVSLSLLVTRSLVLCSSRILNIFVKKALRLSAMNMPTFPITVNVSTSLLLAWISFPVTTYKGGQGPQLLSLEPLLWPPLILPVFSHTFCPSIHRSTLIPPSTRRKTSCLSISKNSESEHILSEARSASSSSLYAMAHHAFPRAISLEKQGEKLIIRRRKTVEEANTFWENNYIDVDTFIITCWFTVKYYIHIYILVVTIANVDSCRLQS